MDRDNWCRINHGCCNYFSSLWASKYVIDTFASLHSVLGTFITIVSSFHESILHDVFGFLFMLYPFWQLRIKKKKFDGTGNVKTVLTNFELEAGLKGHDGEKKAQFAASKVNGHAFDVYTRLTDEDEGNYVLKCELLKEVETDNSRCGIQDLDSRTQ